MSREVSGLKKEKINLIDGLNEHISRGDINSIIFASRTGNYPLRVAEKIKGVKIVSVTEFQYSDDIKKEMKKNNVAFIEKTNLPIQDNALIRDSLLMFGAGVKTAIEVAVIAADKGLASNKVISVACGEKGVDAALLVKTSKSNELFDPDPEKRLAILDFIIFKK